MNLDLAMGDELLKKTGAGNLFMVFGEPDVEIKKQKNGQAYDKLSCRAVSDCPAPFSTRTSQSCWQVRGGVPVS
jgi:hypothetical protein